MNNASPGLMTLNGVVDDLERAGHLRTGYIEKVYEGNRMLRKMFKFIEGPARKDGIIEYSFFRSPLYPNGRILRLNKKGSYIHDVAVITFPETMTVEYYNPNGRGIDLLPDQIKRAILPEGYTLVVNHEKHQGKDSICARHALLRSIKSDLTNDQYGQYLENLRVENGLPTKADVVWNLTQNYLNAEAGIKKVQVVFKSPKGKGLKICPKCYKWKMMNLSP
jgi:hypothetical protein